MRLSTVVTLSLLLGLGIILAAAAIDEHTLEQPRSGASWRAPLLKVATPTPLPPRGWWESPLPKPPPAVSGAPFTTREAQP
jgi:hypothetical protein